MLSTVCLSVSRAFVETFKNSVIISGITPHLCSNSIKKRIVKCVVLGCYKRGLSSNLSSSYDCLQI